MGSFSRYLIDTYGIQNFKKVYKSGEFSVYEKSLEELAQEWQDYLQRIEIPEETTVIAEARFSGPSIFNATCPRRVAELKKVGYEQFNKGNYFRAKDYFSDALKFNNTDPSLINWLAYSHYYNENYNRATEIAESSTAGSKLDKNLLGNINGNSLWQSGNSEAAAQIFNNLLLEHIPDNLKRELEIKISAISEGYEVEENIKLFFGTRDKLLQLAYLEETIKAYPFYAPAHYLLGRLFFNKGEYEKAAPHLIQAYLLELSGEELTNENLRILGISLFAKGNYDQTITTFEYLLSNEQNEAAKQYAQDFIERSRWIKENIETNENQLK
jgi:tetratricopeptide (TPR) repeat protein